MQRARIVALACRNPAELQLPLVRWSVRTLARQVLQDGIVTQIHYSSVCLILQDVDLQPHRTLYWKRGYDPEFEPKAIHILWCYEQIEALEARGELVFACDEKPGIQLLGRPHPDDPARPGCPRRREFEYIRRGTATLFLVLHLASGRFHTQTPTQKSGPHFTAQLDTHLATIPQARKVHYILDNDSTHVCRHTQNWLAEQRGRVRLHFTPKYASWLNQAEIGLNVFSTHYLRKRVWTRPQEFGPHVRTSTAHYNHTFAHPFDWTFTRHRFREWRIRSGDGSTGH